MKGERDEPARSLLFDTVVKCRHCESWWPRIWTDWKCRHCWRDQKYAPSEYDANPAGSVDL